MGKGKKQKAPLPEGIVPIADNRRARHDYEIIETFEAGIVLVGTEVKSLRDKQVNFADSYALLKDGEVFILGLNITKFKYGTHANHEPDRTRKLLLHDKEIRKLFRATKEKGYTLVPLKMYFKKGWAKVLLGVAKGRTKVDKRHELKKKDANREMARAMKKH
ncbi:MAG: SsrA-binding protein [Myxococcales bacterium]|nr:SsrA-binding protein [Myxococcales bacterium]|tara:strand:- start:655 stop:1140 length:486 start_codon:yes stop_codon:yes gene_type:complete